jgi:hypothetical protein
VAGHHFPLPSSRLLTLQRAGGHPDVSHHAGWAACACVQTVDKSAATRPQVDICLYLLPPRRLAASDAAFLRRLAPLVAVQPVRCSEM